ncbi:pre-mRNA-splicing factor 38A-like [Clavelina lepadiformis]|uniref:Pre-mRNA-splicing factor 38 n=1 Tax=Clavelina lepadiformis TaxID=159417 RepID=A0ABP0GFC0_CLALP
MANRTVKDAHTIKGTNPQYLVEKIIRSRIYDSRYWKEECFALSAELLVDKAMELKYAGGVYGGNIKPTPFLCLILKMLQIQPDKDIIVEFIRNEDFKYVRCLGAFYMRLTGTSLDSYKYLEPLLNDFRKIKLQNRDGSFFIKHMDEYVDDLLREERYCDVILPRIQKRQVLEEIEQLEPRISALDDDLDDLGESSDEEEPMPVEVPSRYSSSHRRRSPSPIRDRYRRSPSPKYRRSRSRSPKRRRRSRTPPRRHRSRERDRPRSPPRSHHHHHSKHHDDDSRSSKKSKRSKKDKGDKARDFEIKEANELRAKLGLKPLK